MINTIIDPSLCFKTGLQGHLSASQWSYTFFKRRKKHNIPPLSCTGVGNEEVCILQVPLGDQC